MSEETGPFTDYAQKAQKTQKAQGAPEDSRPPWGIVAGILAALLIAASLLWASALGKTRMLQSRLNEAKAGLGSALAKIQQEKDRAAALQSQAAALQAEAANLQSQTATLQSQEAALQAEKAADSQTAKGLEAEMRADLESKDVTISKLQGKLTVNILDRVMYDSGEAVLQPAGESVLRKVAEILAGHPNLKIHVIGHTDNVPIRSRYASNWELSTARALAAVHFLTEKAGVDPRRVGVVGYGEYRPLADNSTPEGRAKNRRIAITILPDELAGADTPSAPVPAGQQANPIPVPVVPPAK
jgi:chemotaxis protein MotB